MLGNNLLVNIEKFVISEHRHFISGHSFKTVFAALNFTKKYVEFIPNSTYAATYEFIPTPRGPTP